MFWYYFYPLPKLTIKSDFFYSAYKENMTNCIQNIKKYKIVCKILKNMVIGAINMMSWKQKKVNITEKYEHIGILKYYITVANNYCLQLYNLQNKHIILHLIEVLVSHIRKFNILHTTLVHCWNFSRDNFNVYSLMRLDIEKT